MFIIALFTYVEAIRHNLLPYINIFLWVGLGMKIGVMFAISCCNKARRLFPLNIILLAIYTIFEGIFLGIISLYLTGDKVGFLGG